MVFSESRELGSLRSDIQTSHYANVHFRKSQIISALFMHK